METHSTQFVALSLSLTHYYKESLKTEKKNECLEEKKKRIGFTP